MSYNNYKEVKNYWDTRLVPNGNDETVGQDNEDFLRLMTLANKKALEFGPGTGRTIHTYEEGTHITAFDISSNYYSRLKAKAEKLGFGLEYVQQRGEFDKLPFKKNNFEVAVASQSLLHVRPENIKKVVSELLRVSKKLVIINFYSKEEIKLAEHNFNHDLESILKDLGAEYVGEWDEKSNIIRIVSELKETPKKQKRRKKKASGES